MAYIGGAIFILCSFLIFFDVAARSVFNQTPFYSFELTEYGFAVAVAFGYAHTLFTKAHIRIDFLYRHFGARTRLFLDFMALLSLLIVIVVLAWYAVDVVARSIRLDAVSNSSLQMPLAIPQTIWAAGIIWFALACGWLMVRAGYAVITGRAEMASDMLGAEEGEEMEARDALEQADEVLAREREREQELLAEAAANSKNGTP
jgi:TRAP-type C4-dicarboxylate transport system permease small subunit